MVAQDTGSAIVGAVRADYFWGWGDDAEAAGRPDEAAAAHVGALAGVVTPPDAAPAGGRVAGSVDGGRPIDWSRTSADYARAPPRPAAAPVRRCSPRSASAGAGQRVLDLGTGTGLVARELARRGAQRQRHRHRRRADRGSARSARGRGAGGRLRRRRRRGLPVRRRQLRRDRRQPVLDVLRRRADDRRGAPAAAARRRAGDDALQLAAARRCGRARERGAGAALQSGLAGRRLVGPNRRRAGVGARARRACWRCSGSTPTSRSRARAGAAGCARAAASARRCPPPTSTPSTPRSPTGSMPTRRPSSRSATASTPISSSPGRQLRLRAMRRCVERFFVAPRPSSIVSGRLPP